MAIPKDKPLEELITIFDIDAAMQAQIKKNQEQLKKYGRIPSWLERRDRARNHAAHRDARSRLTPEQFRDDVCGGGY